jgi:hypothetical protein
MTPRSTRPAEKAPIRLASTATCIIRGGAGATRRNMRPTASSESTGVHKRREASRFIGVHRGKYIGRPWTAQIRIGNAKRATLGAWRTEKQAAEAYDRAVLFYRGSRSPRNFPNTELVPADGESLKVEARQWPKHMTSSRYRGVVEDPPSWRAQIRPLRRLVHLGNWPTERDAAEAYDRAARYLAFDGRLVNFPHLNVRATVPEDLRREARRTLKLRRATSKYRGVFLSERQSRPWLAQIAVEGRRPRHLGTWATEAAAARAYDRAACFYLGRKGVNFPRERPRPADAATLASEARRESKLVRTSRYIGVSWSEAQSTWRAQLQHRFRNRTIGYFSKQRDAAEAYDALALALRGEAARLNFDPSTGKHVWGKRLVDLPSTGRPI